MGWTKEDREYDRMQEGFYVTGIEKRIKKLEAENSRLREALIDISESDCPEYCKSCELMCNACIAREALKENEK